MAASKKVGFTLWQQFPNVINISNLEGMKKSYLHFIVTSLYWKFAWLKVTFNMNEQHNIIIL